MLLFFSFSLVFFSVFFFFLNKELVNVFLYLTYSTEGNKINKDENKTD